MAFSVSPKDHLVQSQESIIKYVAFEMAGGAQARIHTTVALSPSFLTLQASVSFNCMLTSYPVLGSWVSRLGWRCALGVWLPHRGALRSTPGEGRRQDQAGEGGAATQSTAPAAAAVVSCASDEGGGPWVRQSLKVALPAAGGEPPTPEEGPRRSTQHSGPSLERPRGHLPPFISHPFRSRDGKQRSGWC